MLFVKTKETTEGATTFEVLTRSPFNNKHFIMKDAKFKDLFRCSAEDMLSPNNSNVKDGIFECIDKVFTNKLYWWNTNIKAISPLYASIYEIKDFKASIEMFASLNNLKEDYSLDMGEDAFTFSKDFKFFRSFFNSSKEVAYA